MALTFTNPVHANTGLIFAPQDYASAAVPFAGVSVRTAMRMRGRFPGVGIDSNGFMANDTDPNGDPLSYRLISTVSNGVLETHLGGAFTYTPNPGFVGVDSFVYQLYAGGTAGGTATVTITVTGEFAGVPITSRLRLGALPGTLNFSVIQPGVRSRWRLRTVPAQGSYGLDMAVLRSRLSLRSEPATLLVGGSANRIVNGDFSAPSIAPWILGPNTVASIVNGQLRLSAVAASQTPVYVYQEVLTVPGTTYVLDADVIAGLGFGAAGITVDNPLSGSGGNLSYGGYINASYLVPGNSVFVVLHFAVADPSEFVYFDDVALVGLLGILPANLTGVRSAVRMVSRPATFSAGRDARIVLCTALLDSVAVNPRRRRVIAEKSATILTLNFVDGQGVASAPDAVTYQVDCMTTGTALRAPQALIPAASIDVTLTAADNTLVNQSNVRELRRVTVQATYASGEAVNTQVDYLVRNYSGVV